MSAIKLEVLGEYERLANDLLFVTDNRAIIAAARILALYVGHYQHRYGPIRRDRMDSINSKSPTVDQIQERIEAMRVLGAALALGSVSTQTKAKRKAAPTASPSSRAKKSRPIAR
jgi:hypothetical protein